MTIYLDANVFLTAILADTINGEKARRFLSNISKNPEAAVTSALTFDEVCWKVKQIKGFGDSVLAGENFLQLPGLSILDANQQVMANALSLIKIYQLNPRDAIHAATAILHGADTIISEDRDFDKIQEIKRISLSAYK